MRLEVTSRLCPTRRLPIRRQAERPEPYALFYKATLMVASATKSATRISLHNMSDIGHDGMPFVPYKFHLLSKPCDS